MTTVAVHQPDFVPYLGFFRKMAQSDVFILYDTAQFSKNGFHNRNRIKTPSGPIWITVPVKSPHFRPISDVELDNSTRWGTKLWRSMEANYARASHFDEIAPQLRPILIDQTWEKVAELNFRIIVQVRRFLGLDTHLLRASELPMPESPDPSTKLMELVRSVGGTEYLSGPGGMDYLDASRFRDIKLSFVAPFEAEYPQLWGPFVPDLSVVDALFNCGAEIGRVLRRA